MKHQCTQLLDDGERCTNEYWCADDNAHDNNAHDRCDSCERMWTKYGMGGG